MRPALVLPGGGVYFFWQAGAVHHLREVGYDLGRVRVIGGSAGALAATLTAADVDFEVATRAALELATQHGVWARPHGLLGIWGKLIEQWLHGLLPQDVHEKVAGRLAVLVTQVAWLEKTRVTTFASAEDLVACNMASIHLPWFLDGSFARSFRGVACVDGDWLARPSHYVPTPDAAAVRLEYSLDPTLRRRDVVRALPEDGVWALMEAGRRHARAMQAEGGFEALEAGGEEGVALAAI